MAKMIDIGVFASNRTNKPTPKAQIPVPIRMMDFAMQYAFSVSSPATEQALTLMEIHLLSTIDTNTKIVVAAP